MRSFGIDLQKFLIHRAILDAADQNLFFVDWGKGSKTFAYPMARARVVEVARVVGDFINYLQQNAYLNPSDVTLIGFSLGAHICGLAGKNFTNGKIKKIIGIDPAGPLFDVYDPGNRLSPESASYTECIHSGYTFGIREPICHVDFYVNGGANQPGCSNMFALNSVVCSHYRAVEVFSESLGNPFAFYGRRCNSLDEALRKDCIGEPGAYLNSQRNENERLTGIFHFFTNPSSPFGQGK